MSVSLSVSVYDCVSVCRLCNQGGTNHNRYTYKLVILHGDPNISPWTFFPGVFPSPDNSHIHYSRTFPRTTSSRESFPPNTFPVALDDVLFVVGLAQTQFSPKKQTRFSGIPSWIFAESDHQSIHSSDVYKWFRRMPVAICRS